MVFFVSWSWNRGEIWTAKKINGLFRSGGGESFLLQRDCDDYWFYCSAHNFVIRSWAGLGRRFRLGNSCWAFQQTFFLNETEKVHSTLLNKIGHFVTLSWKILSSIIIISWLHNSCLIMLREKNHGFNLTTSLIC